MPSISLAPRLGRGLAALAIAIAAFAVTTGTSAAPAGAQDAPDGSRSTITQEVVHREPLAGGGWRITIEATLDSNTVCHVFLLQCVVEPQVVTPHMKLQSLECVSPAWVNIDITLPFLGTASTCARGSMPNARAGTRSSGTSSSPISTSAPSTRRFASSDSRRSSSSSARENTITIDLEAEADISEECPDTAAIGTQVDCTVRVEALSNVPTASVNRTVPAQFVNTTLVPDADPGNWDCTAVTSCDYTANGGTLQPGVYTFTATADVVAPPDDVQDCTDVATAGTTLNSACADVRVYEDDTDTFLDIEKASAATDVTPGAPISYTITVTNLGPNPATTLAVFENPPALLAGASLAFTGGDGTWACVNGSTLICTAPTLASGGVATFTVTGTVALTAQDGDVIVNEIAAGWANSPFGPDVTVRDGNAIRVVVNAVVPITPRFTG